MSYTLEPVGTCVGDHSGTLIHMALVGMVMLMYNIPCHGADGDNTHGQCVPLGRNHMDGYLPLY